MKKLLIVVMLLGAIFAQAESVAERDARMAWWTHDRFGMFIHFGLYSLPARHEWMKSISQMSDAEYDRFFKRFNPKNFDAKAWAKMAKAAGMKYAVLTAKHHEGFCLFDSKYTDYKVTNTPFKRDVVREFLDAFRAEGIKVGLYYSLPDWHHPEFPIDRYHPQRPVKCGPWAKEGKEGPDAPWNELNKNRHIAKYREYLYNQVTELLTNYGKLDLLWFDFTMTGPRTKTPEDWQSEKLLALVRKLQPGIIVNDRLGENGKCIYGDFATAEQEFPTKWHEVEGKRYPWELCQTFSGSWGYNRDETSWKSTHRIIELLAASVGHGGNLILNVGPTGLGEFDYRAQAKLTEIGEWMKYNSAAVYGCTEAPAEFEVPRGQALTWNPQTRRLYLYLLDYPENGVIKVGFADKIAYARHLDDDSEVLIKEKGALVIAHNRPRSVVPVIEFEIVK